MVPYTVRIETVQGDKRIEQIQERRAVFTPETLEVAGRADAKTLRRSIFEVPVYAARLKLSGRFAAPRIADVAAEVVAVRWRDAAFVLGLSGVAGLKEATALKIAGAGTAEMPFAPSVGFPSTHLSGIHAKLAGAGSALFPDPEQPPQAFAFTVDLAFNGSLSLIGRAGRARDARVACLRLAASELLRRVPAGRAAGHARGLHGRLENSAPGPQRARGLEPRRDGPGAAAAVCVRRDVIDPVDFYSLVNRAAKYGIMFVAMAFMAVFCLEIVSGRRVHPVQYLFTGIALVFFYVLLLSLAEHLGFAQAYLAASTATGAMLAIYVGAAMSSVARGLVMLAVFAATYGILYLILQLEDYALLAGAILGFAALTVVMFVTLRVDWSGSTARPVPR